MFAVPEVELFQELVDTFEIGQSYHLTVAIFGGGGGMKDDVPIDVCLYYRDAEDNRVTIATTTFTYDADAGYIKHFIDVRVDVPPVTAGDPWAGKSIGIQFISALTLADLDPETGRAGGYWDLDNVRLTKSPVGPDLTGDSFVDFVDFAMMAREWRWCAQTTTDLTDDGCVDFDDLMILSEFWLQDPSQQ